MDKPKTRGAIILAPPGSGKSWYVQNQDIQEWIDQDKLITNLGLVWSNKEENPDLFRKQYKHIEELTFWISYHFGFKIMGSLFWNAPPDAIVLLPLAKHHAFVLKRSDLKWERVLEIRSTLLNIASKHNVPVFDSLELAVLFVDQEP